MLVYRKLALFVRDKITDAINYASYSCRSDILVYANRAMTHYGINRGIPTYDKTSGKKDLVALYNERGVFPSIMVLRCYLKLVLQQCQKLDLINKAWEEVDDSVLTTFRDLYKNFYNFLRILRKLGK